MLTAKPIATDTGEAVVDLRSDTVTRPNQAMYEAMLSAPLGDDMYGDDPTVAELERRVADVLGKEEALFFPSGSQSNLAALMSHCARGEEYITGDCYHVFNNESGSAAVLGAISPYTLPTDRCKRIDPADLAAAVKPDDVHKPRSALVSLENTAMGRVIPRKNVEEIASVAQANDLKVHMDGARLMNAAVASGEAPAALVSAVDSVSLCLSKGLGAPAGSVLAGDQPFIGRARRIRKLLGGAMRQSGILAACGLVALEDYPRLEEDHANAAYLGRSLEVLEELEVDSEAIETNMVFVRIPEGMHGLLEAYLRERSILITGEPGLIRLVTHRDVNRDGIDRFANAVEDFLQGRPAP